MEAPCMALKTVRIIAYNAQTQARNHMKVVNVFNNSPGHNEYAAYLQAHGAPTAGEFPTWMASPSSPNPVFPDKFPNIYIAGYSAPA
jgi:hypothetical protein